MRLCKFEHKGAVRWGLVEDGIVRAVQGQVSAGLDVTDETFPVSEVRFLAPAHESCGKLIAVGLNYRGHIKEAAEKGWDSKPRQEPVIFMLPRTALIGNGDPVRIARPENRTHFEAELVVVIGKRIKEATSGEARDAILGYSCGNDISDRTIQDRDGQWTRCKAFATYKPMGPWIETVAPADGARIKLRRNGELMQDAALSDMIWGPEELVSFVSHQFVLEPGDIIFTGTPEKAGPIASGDLLEVEIDGIGKLENPVR